MAVVMTAETMTVHGIAGQPIMLPISVGPATGYTWSLDLPDGVERLDDAPASPVPLAHALGAAATGALRVKASAGHHRITARLARPWDVGNPLRVVVVEVIVAPP